MGIFVFAAVASPGQDPFSMLALAVAVCVLVEMSIQFARVHDKRKKKSRADWLDVDDDSASPVEPAGGLETSGGLDGSSPPGRPAPIAPPAPVTGAADDSRPLQAPPVGGSLYDDIT